MSVSRRNLLIGATALAFAPREAEAWFRHGKPSGAAPTTFQPIYSPALQNDVWMETPDVIGVMERDDPIKSGNIFTPATPYTDTYGAYHTKNNPRDGNTPYPSSQSCQVVRPDESAVRFVDLYPPRYIDRVAFAQASNYSIVGGAGLTVSAVTARTEFCGAGYDGNFSIQRGMLTAYIQLASPPVANTAYKISHSAAAFPDRTLTFNDKVTRAGGIKVSHGGHRPNDEVKLAYLCSRVPGRGNGVVDFAAYGMGDGATFYLIDAVTLATVATFARISGVGGITIRRAYNQIDTVDSGGGAYLHGFDLTDLSQVWKITSVSTTGNPTTLTFAGGHGFSNGDHMRCFGMSGAGNLENTSDPVNSCSNPATNIALPVTYINATQVSVAVNNTTALTTGTWDHAASGVGPGPHGGYENMAFKCLEATNRAGTNVYGMDYSSFTTPGRYKLYIPGYGVSDEILIDEAAHALTCAHYHRGLYQHRLGMALDYGSYQRGPCQLDGVGGYENYWSTLISMASSEGSGVVLDNMGDHPTHYLSGTGAYNQSLTIPYNFGGSYNWTGRLVSPALRAVGSHPAHQDAGDNDDLASDHMGNINAFVGMIKYIPKNGRVTPFQTPTQLSSAMCDPSVWDSSTDILPAIVHEAIYALEAYRVPQAQIGDGRVPGGYGIGHFAQQTAFAPVSMDTYCGTDPTFASSVHGPIASFLYAADHWTTMLYASAAWNLCDILTQYGLGSSAAYTAYYNSGLAAFNWAYNLYQNLTNQTAYYDGEIGMKTYMVWTDPTFATNMTTLDNHCAPAITSACCSYVKLVGAASAAGSFYETWLTDGGMSSNLINTNINTVDQLNWAYTTGLLARMQTLFGTTTGINMSVYWYNRATVNVNTSQFLADDNCFRGGWGGASSPWQFNGWDALIKVHVMKLNPVPSGNPPTGTDYLKAMQSVVQWCQGANMVGRSHSAMHGLRHIEACTHDDSYNSGIPTPAGWCSPGYWAFCSSSGFPVGNLNGPLSPIAQNVSTTNYGANGYAKQMVPWCYAQSFWELQLQDKFAIQSNESYVWGYEMPFTLTMMYLHAWDGNTAIVPSTASAWTPKKLQNLIGWYKGDNGLFTVNDPTHGVWYVTAWSDNSLYGHTLYNGGENESRPVTDSLNGIQVVQVSTNSDVEGLVSNSFRLIFNPNKMSMFAVVLANGSPSSSRIASWMADIDYVNASDYYTPTSMIGIQFQNSTTISAYHNNAVATQSYTAGGWIRVGSIYDGTNPTTGFTAYVNGVGGTPVAPGSGTLGSPGCIVATKTSAWANAMPGKIAELVVVNDVLSPTDIAALDAYFTAKWGI